MSDQLTPDELQRLAEGMGCTRIIESEAAWIIPGLGFRDLDWLTTAEGCDYIKRWLVGQGHIVVVTMDADSIECEIYGIPMVSADTEQNAVNRAALAVVEGMGER